MSKLSVELDRLDHFALTVRDVDATCVFYEKVLGMSRERFDEDRIALRFGGQRININPNPNDRLRKAAVPVPGSAEFCLVSGLPLEAFIKHLRSSGVDIEFGPVGTTGAEGTNRPAYTKSAERRVGHKRGSKE